MSSIADYNTLNNLMYSLKKAYCDNVKNRPHHLKNITSNIINPEKPLEKPNQTSSKNTQKYIKQIIGNEKKKDLNPSKNSKETIITSNKQIKPISNKNKVKSNIEHKYVEGLS